MREAVEGVLGPGCRGEWAGRDPCVKLIKDDDNPRVKLIKDDENPCVKLIKEDENPCVKCE